MKIRTGTMADLDALATVETQCFPAAEAADKATIQGRLATYADHFWLLLDGDKLVSFVDGMVSATPVLTDKMYEDPTLHDPKGDWQMIFGVNTIPNYRKRGCVGLVLERVIADAKAQGRKGLVLTCKDKLVHYYTKFGFEDYGRSESVHGGAVWYEMRLRF